MRIIIAGGRLRALWHGVAGVARLVAARCRRYRMAWLGATEGATFGLLPHCQGTAP